MNLFDTVIGQPCQLNDLTGIITDTCWINGQLHYTVRWFDLDKLFSKKPKRHEVIIGDATYHESEVKIITT